MSYKVGDQTVAVGLTILVFSFLSPLFLPSLPYVNFDNVGFSSRKIEALNNFSHLRTPPQQVGSPPSEIDKWDNIIKMVLLSIQ